MDKDDKMQGKLRGARPPTTEERLNDPAVRQTPKADPVNPDHYRGDLVMRIIEEFSFEFCDGNVLKYLLRYRQKGGLVDLEKARWYLNRLIAQLKGAISMTPLSSPSDDESPFPLEPSVKWRGSGTDMATDLRAIMSPVSLQVMVNDLLRTGSIVITKDGLGVAAGPNPHEAKGPK